jgi:hypothetical protein
LSRPVGGDGLFIFLEFFEKKRKIIFCQEEAKEGEAKVLGLSWKEIF